MGRSIVSQLELLERAVTIAPSEPAGALSLLERIDLDAPEPECVATRVRGIVALARGDVTGACGHLRTAAQLAEAAGLAGRAAEARMTLAFALAAAGEVEEALQTAVAAGQGVSGTEADRIAVQQVAIMVRLGRVADARVIAHGLPERLVAAGDSTWAARAYTNRGIVAAYIGDHRQAAADFEASRTALPDDSPRAAQALAGWNLGWLAMLRGDLVTALRRLVTATEHYRDDGLYVGRILMNRAEVLLELRLLDEAAEAVGEALAAISDAGERADEAEAKLVAGRIAAARGDHASSATLLTDAIEGFAAQSRRAWRLLAEHTALELGVVGGPHRWNDAVRLADELGRAGLHLPAVGARLVAVRHAVTAGALDAASDLLAEVDAVVRRAPARLRLRARTAEADLLTARGRPGEAIEAVRHGFADLEVLRATLGATELRTAATGIAEDLARIGLRLGMDADDPTLVLEVAERYRAGALRWRSGSPPRDGDLADALTRLRGLAQRIHEAQTSGLDAGPLVDEQVELERRVRELTWETDTASDRVDLPTAEDLCRGLEDRTLVSFVHLHGALHSVVVDAEGCRFGPAAPIDAVTDELRTLRFSLRRLLARLGPQHSLERHRESVRSAAATLDDTLLGAIPDRGGLVVVPSGWLHGLPWGLLPSLAGRSLTIAPSATVWYAAARKPRRDGHVVLAAGPRLEHAEPEIAAVADAWPDAITLRGAEATVAAVTGHLDGAATAHVACHGRFRGDNPLFSHLELADGPLTIYDLERLGRCPERIVLSACDAGSSVVGDGDEVTGLATALLGLGASTVIAPVLAVPDDTTRDLMVAFHSQLAAGSDPATALTAAAGTVEMPNVFCCFGA